MANGTLPEGRQTVTPHLVVKGAGDAIAFYERVFGAQELCRMPGPDGRVMHAAIRIGNSSIFLCDEFPECGSSGPQEGASPVTIHLYVDDTDAVFQAAVEAGAKPVMPPEDMFWGDRYGKLVDPFGHHWSVATPKENLTPEQMQERAAAAFAGA